MSEAEGNVQSQSGLSEEAQQTLNYLQGLEGGIAPTYEDSTLNRTEEEFVPPATSEESLENQAEEEEEEAEESAEGNEENESKAEDSAEEETEGEDVSIDSPLFGGKKKIEASNEEPVKVENLESLNQILKQYDIEDATKLPDVLKDYKQQGEAISKLTEEVGNASAIFESLPAELYKAVVSHVNGEDWRGTLGVKGIDYSADVESVNNELLVETFYPGKFTSDDWEEYNSEDGDPAIKRLVGEFVGMAKNNFSVKKEEVANYKQTLFDNQKKRQDSFQSSLKKSTELLKAKFPDMDENSLKEISSMATPEKALSFLFDEDGNLKEDGLINLSMAKYGTEIVDQYHATLEKKLKSKIETEINSEILSRGADEPTVQSGNTASQIKISKDVQKQIEGLNKLAEANQSKY